MLGDAGLQDEIACSFFIAAISDFFVRRTLQLEDIPSLQNAVARAVAVKDIQDSNSARSQLGKRPAPRSDVSGTSAEGSTSGGQPEQTTTSDQASGKPATKKKRFDGSRECWSCGQTGHYKTQCPRKDPTKN